MTHFQTALGYVEHFGAAFLIIIYFVEWYIESLTYIVSRIHRTRLSLGIVATVQGTNVKSQNNVESQIAERNRTSKEQ